MTLPQLRRATTALASHAFILDASVNHLCQANAFIDFCSHYNIQFLLSATATVC